MLTVALDWFITFTVQCTVHRQSVSTVTEPTVLFRLTITTTLFARSLAYSLTRFKAINAGYDFWCTTAHISYFNSQLSATAGNISSNTETYE